MRKEIAIVLCIVLLAGCSVKRVQNKMSGHRNVVSTDRLAKSELDKSNLTEESFFIQKAEIKVLPENLEINEKGPSSTEEAFFASFFC